MTLKKTLSALCLTMAVLFCGCRAAQSGAPAAAETAPIVHMTVPSRTPGPTARPLPSPESETCSFSDGFERFVACYNSCCAAHGDPNILKDGGWYFDGECRHYRQYENNWLEPELQVFADDAGPIREIRIGFEDHGYTEWGEALSEERAFYTLRCLCGQQSDEELREVLAEVIQAMRSSPHHTDPDETPAVIDPVFCGDYALYHFFSGGIYQLCIIPG